MNKYSAKILELRDDLLKSIKTIMRNNNLDEVPLDDCSEKTVVPWWSNKGHIYEGTVFMVRLNDDQLSLLVDTEAFEDFVSLYEEHDFVFESPIWLNDIRDNILEALSEIHERVCHNCGKPMCEGYSLRNGVEYYCCDPCLQNHYSSDELDELSDGDIYDIHWKQWGEKETDTE